MLKYSIGDIPSTIKDYPKAEGVFYKNAEKLGLDLIRRYYGL